MEKAYFTGKKVENFFERKESIIFAWVREVRSSKRTTNEGSGLGKRCKKEASSKEDEIFKLNQSI